MLHLFCRIPLEFCRKLPDLYQLNLLFYLLTAIWMTMYLLLRDNKQSGPHSLDELKTMGLKAYDLVWVDGKSAAWRYPSEIAELRPFAPVVEEQPFDRFYKRESPVKANTDSVVNTPAGNNASPVSRPAGETIPVSVTPSPGTPLYAGEPSTVPGKRIIYVTMPAGKSPAPSRETAAPAVTRSVTPITVEKTGIAVSPYLPGNSRATYKYEDNTSQLPEKEFTPVELSPRQKQPAVRRLIKPLAIGLSILALLTAGIFIGLSISKDTIAFQQKSIQKTPFTAEGQKEHPAQQLPAPAAVTPPPPADQEPKSDSVPQIIGQASTEAALVTRPAKSLLSKERTAAVRTQTIPPATAVRDSAAAGFPIVHRETVHRTDPAEDKTDAIGKEAMRNSVASQVSVGSNGYTVGTFGGISDLQVTVSNKSAYPLDLVVVEVQYVLASKKVYKTENLYFRGITAGSALMQEAPKSSRGIKVQYKITTINSKELGLSYSGI
jgi:hypothetical protein